MCDDVLRLTCFSFFLGLGVWWTRGASPTSNKWVGDEYERAKSDDSVEFRDDQRIMHGMARHGTA